jgi:hypothetical protein
LDEAQNRQFWCFQDESVRAIPDFGSGNLRSEEMDDFD